MINKNEMNYHIVWCTKFMRPVLVEDVSVRLQELIHAKASEMGGAVLWLEISPNVVQLKCTFLARVAPYQIVYGFKNYSAHVLRKEFSWLNSRLSNLWPRTFYMCTEGSVTQVEVEDFLKDQRITNKPKNDKEKTSYVL